MATQMQRKNRITARRLLERKKQQQSRVFFDLIVDVYSHVDRERARESNFVGRKTWKFQGGGEKMRNASGKVKMSGSEKITTTTPKALFA